MAEYLEIERKFDVDTDFARPDFDAVPGVSVADPVTYHLSATYFDTPDQRLLTARMTLRRRTGGADEGWHMKLPVSAETRRELREPLSDELPAPLAARVAEVTGGVPVAPIATLHTERTVVTLHANGAVVAEIADDVVTAQRLTGNHDPLRWREIEVEVPEPCPPVQEAAAKLLTEAGARPSRSASKLSRVLNV
ncbi:MAG TPA: CYTH domain-containing protein [Trebonia sp.]